MMRHDNTCRATKRTRHCGNAVLPDLSAGRKIDLRAHWKRTVNSRTARVPRPPPPLPTGPLLDCQFEGSIHFPLWTGDSTWHENWLATGIQVLGAIPELAGGWA
ncbi:hypothetical protein HYQ46_009945 [Verticillium longisporum]|nr:hypothetical protein HYQ46_009945 [Verticillium longisporum]